MKIKTHLFFICFCLFLFSPVHIKDLKAQNYTYSVTGSGTADVNGVYIRGGEYNFHDYYTKVSGTSNPMSIYFYDGYWTILPSISNQSYWMYYQNASPLDPNPPTLPLRNYNWVTSGGGHGDPINPPTTSRNNVASTTFLNGSGYSPLPGTPGTNNNPIGRFQLTGSAEGGVLQAVTISLAGTRSGITSVKLWSSTNNSFESGSDIPLIAKADASSVTFNDFNSLVSNSGGTYYFVTVDLAAGATGNVTATIPSQASFTFTGANNPGAFTNAPLSGSSAPLPVDLQNFTATTQDGKVMLKWETATEVNNYGFNVERRSQKSEIRSQNEKNEWEKIGFVEGAGNSNSPKQYSFVDAQTSEVLPHSGGDARNSGGFSRILQYRLKQMDNDGQFKYSNVVEIAFEKLPEKYELFQNYPNPFNPSTTIKFGLPVTSMVSLEVHNILGERVAQLVNEIKDAGYHQVQWNVNGLTSGIYYYMVYAKAEEEGKDFRVVKKMMIIK